MDIISKQAVFGVLAMILASGWLPAYAQSAEQKLAAKEHPYTLSVKNKGENNLTREKMRDGLGDSHNFDGVDFPAKRMFGRFRPSKGFKIRAEYSLEVSVKSIKYETDAKVQLRTYFIGRKHWVVMPHELPDGRHDPNQYPAYKYEILDEQRCDVVFDKPGSTKLVIKSKPVERKDYKLVDKETSTLNGSGVVTKTYGNMDVTVGDEIDDAVVQLIVDGTIVKTYVTKKGLEKSAWLDNPTIDDFAAAYPKVKEHKGVRLIRMETPYYRRSLGR